LAAAGNSRGGYCACHWAAAAERLGCVAVFIPATDLRVLREFAEQPPGGLCERLRLVNVAPALARRALWVTIGNHDQRVGTAQTSEFACAVMAQAVAQDLSPEVELHVTTARGHSTSATAAGEAAAGIRSHLQRP
jgi:hypothetical protein